MRSLSTELGRTLLHLLEAAGEQTDRPSDADPGHTPEDYTITYQGYDAEAAKASLSQISGGKKKRLRK